MAPCTTIRGILSFLALLLDAAGAYRFHEDDTCDAADGVDDSSILRTSYESLLELQAPMTLTDFNELPELTNNYTKDKEFDKDTQDAFGTVFMARDKHTDEVVVVKNISRANYSSAEDEVMSLRLPFVAEIVSKEQKYRSAGDNVSLVMRKYKALASMMWNVARDKWKSWGKQMAYGVWMLHRRQYLHGNLKLENTFIVDDGTDDRVVLAGFGKGTQNCRANACTKKKQGTLGYMAPSILEGQSYGYEVDWWALHVSVATMQAGKRQFAGENRESVTSNIMRYAFQDSFVTDEQFREYLMSTIVTKTAFEALKRNSVRLKMVHKASEHPILRNTFWHGMDPTTQADEIDEFWFQVCTNYSRPENECKRVEGLPEWTNVLPPEDWSDCLSEKWFSSEFWACARR
eukprot:TRINITY_DN7965_c0_g4_i1.p1 TRINITY_DN7965_c0_g4~~TRINITY_DN7965_c0_g4_i1.p1  ORF type:complete len:403 (+),score=56.98 TRINITY_DN7965_c0_g4_i1:86-1294(+)